MMSYDSLRIQYLNQEVQHLIDVCSIQTFKTYVPDA